MVHFDPVATYAKAAPHRRAVVDLETGRRWTYAELDAAADRLAAWLVTQLGPASGVRVATLSKNCAEMLILQYAAVRAGAIFTPLNWRLAPAEIEALVGDAEPGVLFLSESFPAPEGVPLVLPLGEMLTLGVAREQPPSGARRPFDEVATLLYTSGTSGRPKGVMLSEENVFWGCTNFILGHEVDTASTTLCEMPLFHTAGLHAAARAVIQVGGCVAISQGFEPAQSLKRLADPDLRITHYFSVPQMAATLWNQSGFDPAAMQSLVAWVIGGAPNPKAQSERFIGAGVRISEGFGMSETGSNFGMPLDDMNRALDKAGSCGLPFVAIVTRIAGEDGNEVPVGETGELWISGPSVALGYWNQPELTAAAFKDGWFRTGDAARRDAEGFHYIVDRRKDMYISGGENVYPAEVEAALAEMPEVAECAIVGVPDERWGEVGCAYVIPMAGKTLTSIDILDHCLRRLAKFKVPKFVMMTDVIPRTASGKVQKHLLRARALEDMSSH